MSSTFVNTYRAHNNTFTSFSSSEEIIHDHYHSARRFMREALEAHRSGDIEKRFKLSTKAKLTLANLQGALVKVPEEEKKHVQDLIDNLVLLDYLIDRFNIENNDAQGEVTLKALTVAEEGWYKRVQEVQKKRQQKTMSQEQEYAPISQKV